MKNRFLVFRVAIAISLLYIPQAESRWYEQDMPEQGDKIFQQNCAVCHGINAEGFFNQDNTNNNSVSLPPALNGTAHAWHHSKNDLKQIIQNGGKRVGGPTIIGMMPSFNDKLSDRDIDSVISYFQSKWPEDIYQKWASLDSENNNQTFEPEQNSTASMGLEISKMTFMLRSRLGSNKVSEPIKTPVDGIYQTQFGTNYAYLTDDGRYLFMADLIDLEQEQNLTNNAKRKIKTPVAKPKVTGKVEKRNMTDLLKLRLGSDVVSEPVKTPVDGIYQAQFGPNYAYLTRDGRYVFIGNMIDLKQGQNLTSIDKRKTARMLINQFGTQNKAIFPAIGEEKAVLNIFTDTTCPYCRKLHEELPKLQEAGISIHYLPYPRKGREGPGYRPLKQVWCAKDRAKALSIAKELESGNLPAGNCDKGVLVDTGYALGNRLGMVGTPALFKADGEMIQGYVPYQDLIPRVLNN